jgi:tryptophan-rich sensory protein
MYKKVLKFIISIVICQSAGIFCSLFTFDAISDWYVTLEKPLFAPPNWIQFVDYHNKEVKSVK